MAFGLELNGLPGASRNSIITSYNLGSLGMDTWPTLYKATQNDFIARLEKKKMRVT